MVRASRAGLLWVLLLLPSAAWAIGEPNCTSEKHRAFDFWVGQWTVTGPGGDKAGESTIQFAAGGCAIHESWQSAALTGNSYSMYDSGADQWRQLWVDSSGTSILFTGDFTDGKMALKGETPAEDGTLFHRLEWTLQEDGSVLQKWLASEDDGVTWSILFDGLYERVTPEAN